MKSSARMRGSRNNWMNSFLRMTPIRSHMVHATFWCILRTDRQNTNALKITR